MTDPAVDGDVEVGGFNVTPEGWIYHGPLTLDNAAGVYEVMSSLPLPDRIDFSGLTRADSAALALVIELRRRANADKRVLEVANLSAALHTLAGVYGVDALLSIPAT